MGLFFIENPVAASTLARHLNEGISPVGENYYVVFAREPIERFWSGVKKDFPDGSYAEKINLALDNLGKGHLLTQSSSFAGRPVDQVIVMDDQFEESITALIEANNVTWVDNFTLDFTYAKNAASDNSEDGIALEHIRNDETIMAKLSDFYADDFAWFAGLDD